MEKKMNITEARREFMNLPKKFKGTLSSHAIAITRWGRSVMYIVDPEEYESLIETREILGDRSALRGIARGLKDVEEGRVYSAGEVRKKLGI